MISTKQMEKIVNHAQNFTLIMIKPQHSRKTTKTSQLNDPCNSQQQQQNDHILEECHNVFQEPNGVPIHCQVKHSIELVHGYSLPNASVYRRSILENIEIHRKI